MTTDMSVTIFICLKKCGNVHENDSKLNILQADFTDKGATNLERTGRCKVVMHASSQLGWMGFDISYSCAVFSYFFKPIKKEIL